MRLFNTLTRREEPFAPLARQPRADVLVRPDGLRPRAHRQLPDVRRRRRAAPRPEVSGRLRRPARHELHRRRRPHDPRIAEGRRAAARIHRPLHRGVSRGCGGARPRAVEESPRATDPENIEAMGADDPGARGARAHLSQRRVDLLQDFDASPSTASWRASITRASRAAPASTATSTTRKTRATSCSGRRPRRASRRGIPGSARAVRAGTSSARRWRCGCSARRRSTSTPAAST